MQEQVQKQCRQCKQELSLLYFYKDSRLKCGYRSKCKECVNKVHKIYAQKNKDAIQKKALEWRSLHSEHVKEYYKNYKKNNRNRQTALQAKRRACKLNATPSWANLSDIERVYAVADKTTKLTGVQHHVDHIIPLQGKNVCGLHVFDNLCIIPAKMNLQKGNTF